MSNNNNVVVITNAQNNITVVTDENIVNVTNPITNVVEVATPGPQGPVGPQGPLPDTSLFVGTASFNSFTSSYNTGSFTGSFTGDGSQLTGIVSSKWSGSNPITRESDVEITGSLGVTNGITGSLFGTSSWAENFNEIDPIFVAKSASLATTGSNIFIGDQIITGSVTISGSSTFTNIGPAIFSGSVTINESGYVISPSFTGSLFGTSSWADNFNETDPIFTSVSASYTTTSSFNDFTSSYYNDSSSFDSRLDSLTDATSSYVLNSVTESFATTGSNTFNGSQLVSGSLTVVGDVTIFGSSSLINITASQLDVGNNTISVNVFEPVQRFGGLIVYDSGSSNATASLLWDSQTNHWIYQNASGSSYGGGGLISGPKNYGALGTETYPTQNRIVKGEGGDHITDSNITDTGTVISINSNTEVTGSLIATTGISGSFSGSGANLFNIPASGIVGLNLSQISTGSVTAAVSTGTGSFTVVSGSTNLLFVSSSGNVGIGTTTPETRLHIQVPGVNGFREPIVKMSVSDAGNDAFIISNGTGFNNTFWPAFAGYGSSLTRSGLQFIALIPSSADVAGSDRGMINFEALVTDNASNPNNGNFSSVQNRNLFTYSNYTGAFITIGPTGNFGLGTTTPTVRLDVSGSTRLVGNLTVTGSAIISSSNATQLQVGTNLLFVSSSGNVGIGTTSPGTAKLYVNGNIVSNGSITADFNSGFALSSGVLSIKRVVSPMIGVEFLGTSYNMGFGFKRTTTIATNNNGNGLFLYNIIYFQSGSNHSYTELDINPTIIEYLGASPTSVVRGVYIRPVLSGFSTTLYRALEWNNNLGFGLYGSGSSQNLLRGNLHIGSFVTSSNTLSVDGTAYITGSLTVTGSTNLTNNTGTTVFSTNADTFIMTGSFSLSGSMNINGLITGTSSFALTASYIDGGFY